MVGGKLTSKWSTKDKRISNISQYQKYTTIEKSIVFGEAIKIQASVGEPLHVM